MKYKLPENFIIHFINDNEFEIFDKSNSTRSEVLTKLKDIPDKINHYLELSKNIKQINLKNNYTLEIDRIGESKVYLLQDKKLIKGGKLSELMKIINGNESLKYKIDALNAGEKVELHN